LDFYGRIKLVNYIRSEVAKGNSKPDVSSFLFQDDKYLQPVIEDDALLFSLDELDNLELESHSTSKAPSANVPARIADGDSVSRIKELEEQLATVKTQFTEYRTFVQQTIDKRWQENDTSLPDLQTSQKEAASEGEAGYFDSYSYNGTFIPPSP
jgi:protein arginine N-methyltransferase 3